ncbi:NIF3-like protein 1 isoform X2 [Balaenoptera ricei]|uniref:NIF3-like protein 1 isoform X2 n=1 Tax=Balaenoptera ricei TaxID=2746895 RepID=UPI0028BF39ED|nr:NIF3-like protein 1 isoform X2 [Balaenoptera ricei]
MAFGQLKLPPSGAGRLALSTPPTLSRFLGRLRQPASLSANERVGICSPHTAYDAAPQEVNNWLAKGLAVSTSRPIHPSKAPECPTEGKHRVEFNVTHTQDLDKVISAVKGIAGVYVTSFSARSVYKAAYFSFACGSLRRRTMGFFQNKDVP